MGNEATSSVTAGVGATEGTSFLEAGLVASRLDVSAAACGSLSRATMGAGHAVVHQRAGEELAALVVHRLLVERLSGALRDAAMYLPFDDHVIDDAPDVVAAREARELDLAGFTIDLHLADLRAVRPRGRRRRLRR